jgi:hypothetical protein
MSFEPNLGLLAERWRAIRAKSEHVSLYSGVAAPTLSRALNGQTTLSGEELLRISNFVSAAEELVRRCGAALDWRDHNCIKPLLEAYEAELRHPPAEPTSEDLDVFRRFVAGEDLHEIALSHRLKDTDVLARVEKINSRTEHLFRKVAVEKR